MKGWRFPLVVTVYAGLLMLVGLVGGNVWLMLAVSALVILSFGFGLVIGGYGDDSRQNVELRTALAKSVRSHWEIEAQVRALEPQVESLTARNRMLVSLVAKDPQLLAELDDFHAWRSEDPDAAQDQAIANVTGGQS